MFIIWEVYLPVHPILFVEETYVGYTSFCYCATTLRLSSETMIFEWGGVQDREVLCLNLPEWSTLY